MGISKKHHEGRRTPSLPEQQSFDPLKGASKHNLPYERSSKGVSKKSKKKRDVLAICMDEFYKPVNSNQSKPKKTTQNQTKPKPTKMTLKQLPSQTPPKNI